MLNYLIVVFLSACSTVDSVTTPMQEVEALWTAQREEIVTAKVRFRFFRTGSDLYPLTPTQVRAAFTEVNLSANPQNIAAFIKKLSSRAVTGDPWAKLEFTQDGKKTRERGSSDSSVDNVFDGDSHFDVANSGRQVTVYPPGGGPGRLSMDTFRPAPHHSKDYSITGTSQSGVKVSNGQVQFLVDSKNGLVASSTQYDKGVVIEEFLSQGSVTYPGGVAVAPASGRFRYDKGVLVFAEAVAIEDADFNSKLPDDSFRVSVPVGTTVVDSRFGKPVVSVATTPLADVSKAVNSNLRQPTVPLPSSEATRQWPTWSVAIIVAGVVVVCGLSAVLLLRRLRRLR